MQQKLLGQLTRSSSHVQRETDEQSFVPFVLRRTPDSVCRIETFPPFFTFSPRDDAAVDLRTSGFRSLKGSADSVSLHTKKARNWLCKMTMKIEGLFSAIGLLLLLLLLSRSHLATSQEVEDESEFSYEEGSPNGPQRWGEIREEWAICNNGDMQSPIDLLHERVKVLPGLGRLRRSYRAANATLKNRGHDIMLEWPEEAGRIHIDGTDYELKQCHWHSPSEHSINGKRFALELHMVHQSADERVAVVGIMYKIGRPDSFLTELMEYIEEIAGNKEEERVVGFVDPRHIKIGSRKYYRYMGSLTTPPCTQGVVWTISEKIRTVSKDQVSLLREAVHDDAENNARPLQPLNGREIQFYTPRLRKNDEIFHP
ncbi:alpha carbonic anhydrase 7 [Musa acuminata AAA Group]|uniref:alpha carbonic anhydrase 7 n=1 Tax=Musa acuminata AAA Group TaxID=214697 RepID=UPI0031CFF2BF